jgi:hypothetical protein
VLSVVNEDGTTEAGSLIDEIVREGARRMLAAALEAEVDQYIAELAGQRDEAGRRLVVRNGPAPAADRDHDCRTGRGGRAARERQAGRRDDG